MAFPKDPSMAFRKNRFADLNTARRHYAQAQRKVAEQRYLVDKMRRHGEGVSDLKVAEKVLRIFEETLDAMEGHLAFQERANDSSWR